MSQTLQLRRPQYRHPFGYEMAPLNPDTVAEILDYLYNTKAWQSAPDALRRKVTQTRARLYLVGAPKLSGGGTPQTLASLFPGADAPVQEPSSPPVADDDPDAWLERAIAMRMQGLGWTKLEQELLKPRATLRRVVAKEMDERGLTVPTAGDA
jgi:hypothetical protein